MGGSGCVYCSRYKSSPFSHINIQKTMQAHCSGCISESSINSYSLFHGCINMIEQIWSIFSLFLLVIGKHADTVPIPKITESANHLDNTTKQPAHIARKRGSTFDRVLHWHHGDERWVHVGSSRQIIRPTEDSLVRNNFLIKGLIEHTNRTFLLQIVPHV